MRYSLALLFLCGAAIVRLYAAEPVVCDNEVEQARVAVSCIQREWPLRDADAVSEYIKNLGMWLARQVPRGQRVQWRFKVVRDHDPNSFSVGNGYIYVTDGAVEFARTEAEIAAILAHEIGHQLAGHFCDQTQGHEIGLWDLFASHRDEGDKKSIGSLIVSFRWRA